MSNKKKVIVVGGGFAGIQVVRNLDENLFDILLIDKINHHQFQPLFYQVATSGLEPSSISFPFRNIFKHKKNVQIRLAEVFKVNELSKSISTSIGEFDYDYLVMAMGCKTNFFGNKEIEKHSFTLKSTSEAIVIRNHILQTFENIISSLDSEKESLMNLVIVGAGPTGVELAGAFADIKKDILPKDFPGIDFDQFQIYLIEGSKNTLNSMSEQARETSKNCLIEMGVQVITETFVSSYDGNLVTLNNGKIIKTKTVIWAAGIIANTIEGIGKESYGVGNRLIVDRTNAVKDKDSIFAIGDISYMTTPKYPKGHPQVANVAINQAKNLAKNLKKIQLGQATNDYEYTDLGSMATIGRNKAVVDFFSIHLKGFIAWLGWMFLHLMLILSTKNKLIIFIQWASAYFTRNSSLRLIFNYKMKEYNEKQ